MTPIVSIYYFISNQMKHLFSLSIFFILFLVTSCSEGHILTSSDYDKDHYLKAPNEVAAILQIPEQAKKLSILDVRTPAEYQTSCLEGAKNIDANDPSFEDNLSKLDKSASYVVYCRTGHRSAVAITKMKNLGFTNVIEVKGGITNWSSMGNSTTQSCNN